MPRYVDLALKAAGPFMDILTSQFKRQQCLHDHCKDTFVLMVQLSPPDDRIVPISFMRIFYRLLYGDVLYQNKR